MGDGARLTPTDAVDRVVDALTPSRRKRGTVLLGPGVVGCGQYEGPGDSVKERELVKALRGAAGPTVVVVRAVTVNLLRALRTAAPALLVVLDENENENDPRQTLAEQGSLLLGPGAALVVDAAAFKRPHPLIVCAHARDELEGLLRAFRDRPIPLAAAPTPTWFYRILSHPDLADVPAAGYVHAEVLDTAWARFAQTRETAHALVPVGLTPAQTGENGDSGDSGEGDHSAGLAPALAAACLERATGPIFPAPRVIALVLAGLEQQRAETEPKADPSAPTPQQLAIWCQAMRALPHTASLCGMRTPGLGLPLAAPTAAFLAQRALLGARQYAEAIAGADPSRDALDALDEDAVARSSEVLHGASETLTDQESKVVLRGFGFEITRQAVSNSASGAAGFADRIGYPVVLKALSPDLRRRSDVGGVILALSTAAAVRRAYAEIVDNIERRAPTARLDGVLVAEMIGEGLDIRCGGRRLASGEIVLYAQIAGATHLGDPTLAPYPLTPAAAVGFAHAVVARSSLFALRRRSDPEVNDLATLLMRVSAVFERTDDRVLALDLGPARLAATERGYVILDARITQRAHLEGL